QQSDLRHICASPTAQQKARALSTRRCATWPQGRRNPPRTRRDRQCRRCRKPCRWPVTSPVSVRSETPQAKDKFAKAMSESEMLIYAGHGRYGSGPDFDDIKSPRGNFVIGEPYEAGHVTLNKGKTDLQKTVMTKDYQLMMFSGCTPTAIWATCASSPERT